MRRTSHYPLGQLLLEHLAASGLTVGNFAAAIGYRVVPGGVRAIDALLTSGVAAPVLLRRWSESPHAPNAEALQRALAETEAMVAAERAAQDAARRALERARFRPFFQPIPEHGVPSSITIFALIGGHRRHTHALPEDFADWTPAAQRALLARLVPEVHGATRGQTAFMGRALGYRAWPTYDGPALRLSVDGDYLGEEDARWLDPGASRVRLS
jgi:hypothetical protein